MMKKEKQSSGKALSEAAKKYIEEHSAEKYSMERMAGALFVNGCYLLRSFKAQEGVTPLYYHHKIRCDNAKKLLSRTDLSITEVGEQVGFVSSSHFAHIFKKMEGCTPSEYRAQYSIEHTTENDKETENNPLSP